MELGTDGMRNAIQTTGKALHYRSRYCRFPVKMNYAPINVKPEGGESGIGWGFRHFLKKINYQNPHPRAKNDGFLLFYYLKLKDQLHGV